MRQGIDQETPHTKRTQRNVQAGEDAERPRDASQNTDAVNTEQYPGLLRLTLILVSLYLSVFLIGLDQTIIITAVPKITAQFHSINDVGWYGSAYLLTTASFQLLYGRLYKVFIFTITVFKIRSIICGVAINSTTLIVERVVAGFKRGCAGILSGGLIIIAHCVPLDRRPLFTALEWGGAEFEWGNWRVILLFVMFGVLTLAFLVDQKIMGELATIPVRIIRNGSVWSSAFFASLVVGSFFILLFSLPIWFQAIKGDTAVQSGIRILAFIIASIVSSVLSEALVQCFGYYSPLMIGGSLLMALGSGLLTTMHPDTSLSKYVGYQFIAGFGMGLGTQMSALVVQNVLAMTDVPIGVVVIVFSQSLGGAVCIAIANSLFLNRLIKPLAVHAPSLDIQFALSLGPTHLKQGLGNVSQLVLEGVYRAYNDAIVDTIYVSTVVAALSALGAFVMEWKSLKRPKSGGVGGLT